MPAVLVQAPVTRLSVWIPPSKQPRRSRKRLTRLPSGAVERPLRGRSSPGYFFFRFFFLLSFSRLRRSLMASLFSGFAAEGGA